MANRFEEIVQSYNADRLKNFDGDARATRSYLIGKLMEELGEYCEIANMTQFITDRKAAKYQLIGSDGKLDHLRTAKFIRQNLFSESGDVVWMALSLAFLDGHDMESLTAYLETRKDAARKTV